MLCGKGRVRTQDLGYQSGALWPLCYPPGGNLEKTMFSLHLTLLLPTHSAAAIRIGPGPLPGWDNDGSLATPLHSALEVAAAPFAALLLQQRSTPTGSSPPRAAAALSSWLRGGPAISRVWRLPGQGPVHPKHPSFPTSEKRNRALYFLRIPGFLLKTPNLSWTWIEHTPAANAFL